MEGSVQGLATEEPVSVVRETAAGMGEGVIERDISLRQLDTGWDQCIRVTASINGGWTSAVSEHERFGGRHGPTRFTRPGAHLGSFCTVYFYGTI
jgi:hypothetical protein